MKKRIKNYLVSIKNKNPWLLYMWCEYQRYKGVYYLKKWNDFDAINKLYFEFLGKYPNLLSPTTFSEKQQWLKLYYQNPLMTTCGDKIEARAYVIEKGYKDILNEVLEIYHNV